MNNPAYIYGLYCALDGTLKYVGLTNNPPARYAQHLADKADTPKVTWMNTLREHGLKPVMGIIEECTESNARSRELFWIEYYLSKGVELTNSTLGFEQKTVQSVARYYISHLRPKRAVMVVQKTDRREIRKSNVARSAKAWDKVVAYIEVNPLDANLTTRELEKRIGVSRSTIANVLATMRNTPQTD